MIWVAYRLQIIPVAARAAEKSQPDCIAIAKRNSSAGEPDCCAVDTFSMGRLISASPAMTKPHLKVGAQKWTAANRNKLGSVIKVTLQRIHQIVSTKGIFRLIIDKSSRHRKKLDEIIQINQQLKLMFGGFSYKLYYKH
jgi:hypothetical protein